MESLLRARCPGPCGRNYDLLTYAQDLSWSLTGFCETGRIQNSIRELTRKSVLQQLHGDVENRHSAFCFAFGRSMMGVAVKCGSDGKSVQRLLEPARSQEGIDLERL